MLWLVRSHEAGHGAGYVTVWTRHVTHVTYVTYMYLYSSNHMYVVFMFYLSININNSPVCHEAVLADCLGHVST